MSKFIGDVIWSLVAELGLIGLWAAKLEAGNETGIAAVAG